jgi:hypothetical protein
MPYDAVHVWFLKETIWTPDRALSHSLALCLTATFFVANMLLAIVVEHYAIVRDRSGGDWVDEELYTFFVDKCMVLSEKLPEKYGEKVTSLIEGLEDKRK